MTEVLICIAWVYSGLMIKATTDRLMSIEYEQMQYVAAMVVGPFIIWPILTIDVPFYRGMQEYRRQCTAELERIIEEERGKSRSH